MKTRSRHPSPLATARRRLLGVGALLLAACGNGNRGDVVGPPESGVQIDMNGTWAVAEIERRDSAAPLPTASPIGAPLFPLVVGQVVAITAGVAYGYGYGDQPLFLGWGGAEPQRYTNVADGRTWLLEVATAWQTSCWSNLAVRAAFAPVDADTMTGVVDVQYDSDCSPSFLIHQPNGSFAVRLVRVSVPSVMAEPAGSR